MSFGPPQQETAEWRPVQWGSGLDEGPLGIMINERARAARRRAAQEARIRVRAVLQRRGDGGGVRPLPCRQQQPHQFDRVAMADRAAGVHVPGGEDVEQVWAGTVECLALSASLRSAHRPGRCDRLGS